MPEEVCARVYLFATLRERAGGRRFFRLCLPRGSTLMDLLRRLDEEVPGLLEEVVEDGRVREGYKVMVNGRDADFLGGLGIELEDGWEIHVFPPVAGG